MRVLAFIPAIVLAGIAIVAVLILAGHEMDMVTTHFQTVQEAREKGAFERGWLPPVLPESARDITETNNLDLNIGEGSFVFDASDYSLLVSRLAPATPEIAKGWSSRAAQGFSIFTHSTDGARWTLALHPQGRGVYSVSSSR